MLCACAVLCRVVAAVGLVSRTGNAQQLLPGAWQAHCVLSLAPHLPASRDLSLTHHTICLWPRKMSIASSCENASREQDVPCMGPEIPRVQSPRWNEGGRRRPSDTSVCSQLPPAKAGGLIHSVLSSPWWFGLSEAQASELKALKPWGQVSLPGSCHCDRKSEQHTWLTGAARLGRGRYCHSLLTM